MTVHWASLSGSTCSSYLQVINGQLESLLLDMKAEVGDYEQSNVKRRSLYSPCFSFFAVNRTSLVNQIPYKCQFQLKMHFCAGILGKNSRFLILFKMAFTVELDMHFLSCLWLSCS